MRKQQWRSLVTLVASMPLLGCSVMGLDDFGVAPCQTNADCSKAEPLLRPGLSACGAAVCQKGLCQWQEGREICNGKDDDCDGLIDEGVAFPAISSVPAEAVPAAVAYAFEPESGETFVAVAVDRGASQGFSLGPGGIDTRSDILYQSALGEGCPKISANAVATCNFAELALAADARHLVFASINTYGCSEGQLRIGLSDLDTTPFTVWLGKANGVQTEEESNIAFGVDVDQALGCTGATGAASGATALGATRPAVASLGTEAGGEGALVLWLAAAARTGVATASVTPAVPDSIPVEALGLVVPAEAPEWLNGVNNGTPMPVGNSTSRSAPAVLALKSPSGSGKYLVAFPAEGEGELGIQLLSVWVSMSSLHFEPLQFLPVGSADQVSLALGKPDEVGLAWLSGNGADAELCFTTVSSSGAWPGPQTVSKFRTSEPTFAAQILYRDEGFATNEPSGGWFLSWVEAAGSDTQESQLARVRAGTLEALVQRTLHSGAIARTPLYPTVVDEVSSVGYAVIEPTVSGQAHLETNSDWCQ